MATTRPFAYNPSQSPIDGTDQLVDLAIGVSSQDYSVDPGSVDWWMGPDEDNGYIICIPIPGNTQPTPISGVTASVGFFQSEFLTEISFVELVNNQFNQNFADGNTAKSWLNSQGYWTSYNTAHIPQVLMTLDSTTGITSNIWADISGNGRNGTLYNDYSITTYNGNQVVALSGSTSFVIPIAGFGTTMNSYGLTYEVWVYPTKSTNGTLIAEWQGFPPTGWNDAQMGFVSGSINAGVYPNTFNPTGYLTGPSFSTNTWYYIVLTYDVVSGSQRLYVNGSLIGTTFGTKADPPATTLTLGRPDTANSYLGGASGYFRGYVGFWRVWDGAISGAQVTTNYNNRKSIYGL